MKDQIVNEIQVQTQADSLLNLESLIKNHVKGIQELKAELKNTREMFEDSFNNNPTFHEHSERVKEVSKAKNSVRAEILKQPAVASLNQKVKDIRFDLNEKQKTLSDLLLDYKESTKAEQLELFDGQTMSLVTTVKLVRRK